MKILLGIFCFACLCNIVSCRVSSISKNQEKEYLNILDIMQRNNMLVVESSSSYGYPPELIESVKRNNLYTVHITYPDSVVYFSKNKTFTIEGYVYTFSKTNSVVETYEDTGDGRKRWYIKPRWYYAVDSPW